MGSSKTVTTGYRYYLGVHLGWLHGPVDKLLRLRVDERDLWNGIAETEQTLTVAKEGLFGGDTREGGMAGTIRYQPGAATQTPSTYLQIAMSAEAPAYRGIVGTVLEKVYIGTTSYLKKLSGKFQRIYTADDGAEQWYPEKAGIAGAVLSAYEETVNTNFSVHGPLATPDPSVSNGLTVACAVADTLRLQIVDGLAYSGWSRWADDSENGGLTWGCWVGVKNNDTSVITSYFDGPYATQAEAFLAAKAAGVIELTGATSWTVFAYDGPSEAFNNREGMAVRVTVLRASTLALDMNPAHIIREALTNPDWGLGYPDGDMGTSFTTAADTLYTEGFGLSLVWDRQQPIDEFVEQVRKHIDAALYLDPATGLFELKLIRDDYDVEDLLVFNEDNIKEVTDYTRRQFEELINSVVLKYEDNGTDKPASCEVQDIAQIQTQGAIISTTVAYPGIANASLAGRIAARELRALSSPLISATIHVKPADGRTLRIGQPIVVEWPDFGVTSMVARVTGLSFGDGVKNNVRVSIVQDVFKTPAVSYVTAIGSDWVDISTDPTAVTAQLTFEAPYYLLARELGQSAVDASLAADNSIGLVCAAALRPTGAINFVHATDNGAGYEELSEPGNFCPCCTVDTDIVRTDEVWAVTPEAGFTSLVAGDYGQIDAELVKVVTSTSSTLTVKRGMLDTVPAVHSAGARLFAWSRGFSQDTTEYVSGEEIASKILPVTGRGALPIADASAMTLTLAGRAIRPYPPGDVQVNGSVAPTALVGDLTVSWTHRDRTQQTGAELIEQDAADIGPEAGVTYNVRVHDDDTDAILEDTAGLDTTSHAISNAVLDASSNLRVQVWSTRRNESLAALAAAFEILTDSPLLMWRFLLTGGGRVDIVYNTTMFGNFYEARRYSSAGALQTSLNCRQISSASFDAVTGLIALGTYTLPLTDASELWFIDVSIAGLTKVAVAPDFPTPSGAERIYVAAGGGNVVAINYDHSRIIKYDADGIELLQVDEALANTAFAFNGTSLVFAISGGFAQYDPSDLTWIADVTFSPAATRLSSLSLVDGELMFLGEPDDPGLATLYRYNVSTGARIASYANLPFHANGSPVLSFFTPYLAVGDATPVVYDTTDWTVVTSAGAAASQESWQRHELTFSYSSSDARLAESGDFRVTDETDTRVSE